MTRSAVTALSCIALLCAGCAGERPESERERMMEEAREEHGPIPRYAGYFGNLDFEAGEENEGHEYEIAVAWKGGGAGYEFSLETVAPRTGDYAARLARVRDDIPEPNNFGAITQCADTAPFHGRRLRYSAWVRTEGVKNGFCGLYVRVDGEGLEPLWFDNMKSRPITGTTGWYLAKDLGYLDLAWPQFGWVAAALALLAFLTVQGTGYLLPTNLRVCFELQKPRPDSEKIGRMMRSFFFIVAMQGTMQVLMIVIMARFVTGL